MMLWDPVREMLNDDELGVRAANLLFRENMGKHRWAYLIQRWGRGGR